MKILFVATECLPYSKPGGLSDAVYGLARQLNKQKEDIRIVLPCYRGVLDIDNMECVVKNLDVPLWTYSRNANIYKTKKHDGGSSFERRTPFLGIQNHSLKYYLVENEFYFERENIYGYVDDYERFIFFCRSVLEMLISDEFIQKEDGWFPDIIQGYNSICGLIPAWLPQYEIGDKRFQGCRFILDLHNLNYVGRYNIRGLQVALLEEQGIYPQFETHWEINLMGRGLIGADKIVMPPPFSRESSPLLSQVEKLSSLFESRTQDGGLVNISNGIDYLEYNPDKDTNLPIHFSNQNPDDRIQNKIKFQEELGFEVDSKIPLLGMIGPIREDRGFQLLEGLKDSLFDQGRVQFVILAEEQESQRDTQMIKNWLSGWKRTNWNNNKPWMDLFFGYDVTLARRIYAACDITLIPFRYAPSVTQQYIAMHYGAVPVAYESGALEQSIINDDPKLDLHSMRYSGKGVGFTFKEYTGEALFRTVTRALDCYSDERRWTRLQLHNMSEDFSWEAPAHKFVRLYEEVLRQPRRPMPQGERLKQERYAQLLQAIMEIDGLPGLRLRDARHLLKQAARLLRWVLGCDAAYFWILSESLPRLKQVEINQHQVLKLPNGQQVELVSSLAHHGLNDPQDQQEATQLLFKSVELPFWEISTGDSGGLCQPINGLEKSQFAVSKGWQEGRSVNISAHGRLIGRIDVLFTQIIEPKEEAWFDSSLSTLASAFGLRLESIRYAREKDEAVFVGQEVISTHSLSDVSQKIVDLSKEHVHAEEAWVFLLEGNKPVALTNPVPDAIYDVVQLAQSRKGTMYIRDWATTLNAKRHSTELRSFLAVPLESENAGQSGEIIGWLVVASSEPGAFTINQEHSLTSTLAPLATAGLQTNLWHRIADQDRLHKLTTLATSLVGGVEFKQLLDQAIKAFANALHAMGASLYLVDEANDKLLRIRAAAGFHKPLLEAGTIEYHLDTTEKLGITGYIGLTGEPLKFDSLDEMHDHQAWRGKYLEQQQNIEPNTFMGFPLNILDRPGEKANTIGVLKLEEREDLPGLPDIFSGEDYQLGEMMANMLATVVYNFRLNDARLRDVNNNLQQLSAAMAGGLEQQTLVQRIVDTIGEIMHADAASLYLLEPDGHTLRIRAAYGYQTILLEKGKTYDLNGKGVTAWIAQTGKPFKANSLKELHDHVAWEGRNNPSQDNREPNAFLGIPLKVGEGDRQDVIGILKVEDITKGPGHPEGYFTQQDEILVQMMGSAIAAVIQNARLSDARLQDLNNNLQRLSTAMTGGLEQNTLVRGIVDTIAQIMHADAASLYLLEPDGHTLRIRAAYGYQTILLEKGKTYDLNGKGVTAWIAQTGKSFKANSLKELHDHVTWEGRNNPSQDNREPNAFLGIPLKVGEGDRQDVIGVLKVEDIKKGPGHPEEHFTDQDEILVQMMGSAIAAVIQNTRLSDARLQDLNNNLQRLSTAMTGGLEQNTLVRGIVDTIAQIMHADAASLYLLEPDGHTLRIRAAYGYQTILLEKGKTYDLNGKGITAWIAQTGKSFKANSLKELHDHVTWEGRNNPSQGNREPNAFLGIPLKVGEGDRQDVIGVLKVEDIKKGPGHPEVYFTDQDEILVQMMGKIIATIIYNTRQGDERLANVLTNALGGGLPLREDSAVLEAWIPLLQSKDRAVHEAFAEAFFNALYPIDYDGLVVQTRLLLKMEPRIELFRVLSSLSPNDSSQSWFDALLRYLPSSDIMPERIVDALLLERDWMMAMNAIHPDEAILAVQSLADSFTNACRAHIVSSEQIDCWHIYQAEGALPATVSARLQVIPRRLPLLIYQGHDWRLDQAESSIRSFLAKSHQFDEARFALLVILLPDGQREQLEQEIETVLKTYSFDCLFLKLKDFQDLTCWRDSQRLLLNKVLNVANLEIISPYRGEGPTSASMFCGREEQLREITNHIRLNSYCIIGGRKLGKTSILMKLHTDRLRAAEFRSVYFSIDKARTYDEFLKQPAHSWQPEPPENAPRTLNELLEHAGEYKNLVLLVDEIDKIIEDEQQHNWRLLNRLRGLANERQLQVVFTGENSINHIHDGGVGPLHNFTTRLILPLLNDREVHELVTRPLEDLQIQLENKDQISDQIFNFSSGHPAVVQYICRRLIRIVNKEQRRHILLSDVEAVIADPDFQRNEFLKTFWEGSSPLERIISIAMARQKTTFTLSDVQNMLDESLKLHFPDHECLDALDTLVDIRAILRRTTEGFEFAIPEFRSALSVGVLVDELLRSNLSEYSAKIKPTGKKN